MHAIERHRSYLIYASKTIPRWLRPDAIDATHCELPPVWYEPRILTLQRQHECLERAASVLRILLEIKVALMKQFFILVGVVALAAVALLAICCALSVSSSVLGCKISPQGKPSSRLRYQFIQP